MSINLELPKLTDLKPRITVIGVGGAGGNAVNNMIAAGLNGVDYVVANTDAQALSTSSAERRIQLGVNLTGGLGAGSKPEIGEAAAEEAIEDIKAHITGSHMVFIAAGMGGGTGTGAASVVARISREAGVLTVGIVTKPFQFEGARRMRMAEAGIAELKKYVDTLIVIPNQNLFRIANEKTTFSEAFVLADQVLYAGVACIVDLIVKEGLINLDFADVRTVMTGMGTAMMGTGEASGDRRAIRAAEEAIANPLIDGVSLKGAKGLLLSIIGGRDMTLFEVDEAASRIRQEVDPEANIIVGATFDESMGERIRVAIVAAGLTAQVRQPGQPPFAEPGQRPSTLTKPPPVQPPSPQVTRAGTVPPPLDPRAQGPRQSQPLPYSSLVQSEAAAPPPIRHSDRVPDQPARQTREVWRAPGDVAIEETMPGLDEAPARHAAPSRSGPPVQHAQAHGFAPAAPQEMPRATARRMPAVDDFPVVGQREYLAKAGQYGFNPQIPPGPPLQPPQARDEYSPHQPPRGGLLRRWSGRREARTDTDQLLAHRAGQSFFFNRGNG